MELEKTIKTHNLLETFHQEMGKIIFYFNQCIESAKYDTKEKLVLYVLIKKIISNVTSANILIYEGQINEAKIILRSAIESVILITYLSQFPEKINDYLDEAQIIKIKNNFIVFKNMRDSEPIDVYGNTCTKEDLIKENKQCFDKINKTAQDKILKSIKLKDFNITDENLDKFNKYFKNFRPHFMKFDKMFRELDNKGFKIKDVQDYSLKDIVYCFYNESSQVAHSCFLDWHHKIKFNKKESEYLFSYFIKTTLFLQVLIKETINLKPKNTDAYINEMKRAHSNLEKLIYGHTLNH